ncbi:serine hydrolase domain-containing protein [Actinosynnema sp. NPDC020468]|uniref:serine hydrolase domain-containing protein n=1 Tax=Actinosynnema sp. NPDC020468 TaxID=3154488 RepID=UPI0033C3A69F
MSTLHELGGWIERRLPDLLAENDVPAASVAVYAKGEYFTFAAGVLNRATGVEADVDSVFQIGSITKVWTTTLAMQLVDEGLLDLDAAVRVYLPTFALADEEAAAAITVRQLMCHQAGFEGDYFTDTGRGEDAVAKFVDTLADVPQLFAPGEMFSYNNAAFCVLGRIVEVLRDKDYGRCLQEHLFAPLGLAHAAPSPYEAILFRAAAGHLRPEPGAAPETAHAWALTPSNAPAGSMLAMRPRDLVEFGRMHLRDGEGPDGVTVLSAASARLMREPQTEVPDLGGFADAWGLGWAIDHWEGGTAVGHDGGTLGQTAFFRIAPEHDVAVAVLTNGGDPLALYHEIFARAFGDLAGLGVPPAAVPNPAAEPVDASRYVGEYSSAAITSVVTQDEDGRIWLRRTPKGVFADLKGLDDRIELVAHGEDTLIAVEPFNGMHMAHAFVGDDGTGRARFLHTGRADRRVEP